MLWENLREEEFKDAIKTSGGVCVVPIGCVEKHGQHLPVGTDIQTSYYVARKAAEKEPVVVFPPLYFGDVAEHTTHIGGIGFSQQLLLALLGEICSEISRNGFKKILFLNGHGGNRIMLNFFIRSTMREKKDYVVLSRNDFSYVVKDLARDLEAGEVFPELTEEDIEYVKDFVREGKITGHACLNETSIMMKINPESVKAERMFAESGLPTHKTDYLKWTDVLASERFWTAEFPNHYMGDHPTGANARIGEVLLRKRIEHQAETCRLLKADDRILEFNSEKDARRNWWDEE